MKEPQNGRTAERQGPTGGRRWIPAVLAISLALAATVTVFVFRLTGRVELPALPGTAHGAPAVAFDDFAGAGACRDW